MERAPETVSPYLERRLRSLAEVQEERARRERLRLSARQTQERPYRITSNNGESWT
jgi:urease accessory protein UreE